MTHLVSLSRSFQVLEYLVHPQLLEHLELVRLAHPVDRPEAFHPEAVGPALPEAVGPGLPVVGLAFLELADPELQVARQPVRPRAVAADFAAVVAQTQSARSC